MNTRSRWLGCMQGRKRYSLTDPDKLQTKRSLGHGAALFNATSPFTEPRVIW